MNTKKGEYMIGLLVIRVPLRSHPIDVLRAQTVFFEEEDHQCEGRVFSSITGFQTLSGRRNDEIY